MAGSSTTSSSRGSTYESGSTAPRSTTTGCGIGSVCSGRSPSPACEHRRRGRSGGPCSATRTHPRGSSPSWRPSPSSRCSGWGIGRFEALVETIGPHVRHGARLVTTRLDNDDALATDFVERVQQLARPLSDGFILFPNGLFYSRGCCIAAGTTSTRSSPVSRAHQPEPCTSSHTSRSHDTAPSCSTGIGCGSKWCTTATPTTMCVARSPAPTGCSGRPHAARRGRRAGRIIEQRVLLGTRGRTPRLRRSTRRGDGRRRVGSRS